MEKRKLGSQGLVVSTMGLGCMGMSQAYGAPDEAESVATLHRAIELGIDFFDTADVYGNHHNEELLGKTLKPYRDRDQVRQCLLRRQAQRQRPAGICALGLRRIAAAPRRGSYRPLLPASRGPERADRRDGGGDGGSGAAGKGALPGPFGSFGRNHSPRA